MEFYCVLSVGGSLASYGVQKESDTKYRAVLVTNNWKRDDLPAEILLQKETDGWQSNPFHAEIVPGLTAAIEANQPGKG